MGDEGHQLGGVGHGAKRSLHPYSIEISGGSRLADGGDWWVVRPAVGAIGHRW